MIRFEFYQNQILKFLSKGKSILVLGASSDEASLFHKGFLEKLKAWQRPTLPCLKTKYHWR